MKKHILVKLGEENLKSAQSRELVFLPDDSEANKIITDIENCPHAFFLACIMDRQINAEKAWAIPVKIMRLIGDTSIEALGSLSIKDYKKLFTMHSLHRFNDTMAEIFYCAVHRIADEYDGDASTIWANNPSSFEVVYRFLQFDGVGPKIATMATNILIRDFCISMSDYSAIDVSVDVHIRRVMKRMGMVRENCSNDEIILKAKILHPSYPGIIDAPLWMIGRGYCHPTNPNCRECIVKKECDYWLENRKD